MTNPTPDQMREIAEALRETATQAADWFTEYAALQRAKGTKDGDAKADTNVGRAAWLLGRIDAALHNKDRTAMSAWQPIKSAPRDGSLFTAYHLVWKRWAVVNWDDGERHGEPGYSELDRSSGWLIRDGVQSNWMWSGATLPNPPTSETAEGIEP